jgi:hypothetical protein
VERIGSRTLLAGGIAGPILFIVAFTALGAVRSDYDPMRMFVSLLSLSDDGWPMTLTFLVSGGLVMAGAVGIRRVIQTGPGARWIPISIGLAGLGLVVAGIFPTDPVQGYPPGAPTVMPSSASTRAYIHVAAALLIFLFVPVAALIAARRFRLDGQPGWAAWSAASGVVMLVANAVTSGSPGTAGLVPDVAGLLQRVSLIAGFVWLALFSLRLLRSVEVAGHPGAGTGLVDR